MKKVFIILLTFLMCLACAAKGPFHYPAIRWMADKDRIPGGMPPSDKKYTALDAADKEIFQQFEKMIAITQGIGFASTSLALGRQEALNVNNFDETFDSAWFTNRLGRYDLSLQEIVKGPKSTSPPDMSGPLIVKGAKVYGVIPRLLIKDRRGRLYVFKFDPPGLKGLATSSELITSIIMHAAGYNVPENYIVDLNPRQLVLDAKAKTRKKYGKLSDMSKEDLETVIKKVSGGQPGKIRAIATKLFKGKILGPFSFNGRRYGDKNDRIPHQHHRELRGYRVFSSFVNNIDALEYDTLDTFIPVYDEKGYVKHHLFDLSSTFDGVGRWIKKKKDKDFLTVKDFSPGSWQASYPNAAFAYMTKRDAFWATKILMRLPDKAIKAIVRKARYPQRSTENYVIKSLIGRKNKIGQYWFSRINPLDNFNLVGKQNEFIINFEDLAIKYGFAKPRDTNYRFIVRTQYGRADLTPWIETKNPYITIDADIFNHMKKGRIYLVKVETKRTRDEWWMRSIDLYLKKGHKDLKLLGLIRR